MEAMKSSKLCLDPIQHKCGQLFELWKGKGKVNQAGKYRQILLEDNLGKTIKKATRTSLVDNAEKYMYKSQTGGLPRRLTEQATHLVRLVMEVEGIRLTGLLIRADSEKKS